MPKLYTYQSKSGGYIQTTIDDTPQSLQVAPSAEELFLELGFDYGDYIPRDVTKPLIMLGVLATKPHGRTKQELLAGIPQLAVDYCELDDDQQQTLQEYLQRRVADLPTPEYEQLDEFLNKESPLDTLPQVPEAPPKPSKDVPSEPPETLPNIDIDLSAIPATLQDREQWLCWRTETRDGKLTKVPVSPHDGDFGKVNDPSTWASFEVAVDALTKDEIAGLGFVFTEDDTIAGVDLDDMRDPETEALSDRAEEIVDRLESYTEVSPSGTGLHVLVHGFVPDGRARNDGIELYDSGRFFTVTGQQLPETPSEIKVRHDALAAVHESYVAREEEPEPTPPQSSDRPDVPAPETDVNEAEIIEYGQRKRKFRRLWDGDTSGYQSHSEADLAMCVLLAYYTGDDRRLMDSVFRQSGLMRSKWDEQRGDQTYGELTIDEAIRIVDTYDPHLHGMDAAAPEAEIARLEPEQNATIEATVESVESVPTDAIEQAGEFKDDTGQIRFVVWASDYWDPDVEFTQGVTYRVADTWVTEYQGQRQVHINEHTAVEKQ
jgi:hypothetical protein